MALQQAGTARGSTTDLRVWSDTLSDAVFTSPILQPLHFAAPVQDASQDQLMQMTGSRITYMFYY